MHHTKEDAVFPAIRAGDRDAVRRLIEEAPGRVHARSPRSFDATVVTTAVGANDLGMVDLLLGLGADINAGSTWWAGAWRPIHTVINPARDEMAHALIERGAEVDAHAAAGLGDLDRLEDLIREDPTVVHARGGDGCTPLHFARNAQVVDLLLEHGARIDAVDIDHESTALHWSISTRRDVGAHLADRGARDDVFLWTAADRADRLAAYLDAHPDARDDRTDHGRFRTHHSDAQHIYCYLIDSNATALHAAAKFDAADAARLLLDRGADPNVRGGYDDSTPLHSAAWNDSPAAARVLLENGAEIDMRSGAMHQSPPLMWAIMPGSVRMVETLLEGGATVTEGLRKAAATGASGGFRQFGGQRPIEDWQRIRELVG